MRRKYPSFDYCLLATETSEIVEHSWYASKSLQEFQHRMKYWMREKRKREEEDQKDQEEIYNTVRKICLHSPKKMRLEL